MGKSIVVEQGLVTRAPGCIFGTGTSIASGSNRRSVNAEVKERRGMSTGRVDYYEE